jgi:hypothetical protein
VLIYTSFDLKEFLLVERTWSFIFFPLTMRGTSYLSDFSSVANAARYAIGEDAEDWLVCMKEFFLDPFFFPKPIGCGFCHEDRVKMIRSSVFTKAPHLENHTFATPHWNLFAKLGYYEVWNADLSVQEVFGEQALRELLIENQLKRAKL